MEISEGRKGGRMEGRADCSSAWENRSWEEGIPLRARKSLPVTRLLREGEPTSDRGVGRAMRPLKAFNIFSISSLVSSSVPSNRHRSWGKKRVFGCPKRGQLTLRKGRDFLWHPHMETNNIPSCNEKCIPFLMLFLLLWIHGENLFG